jgi:hypothetical protein
MSDPVLRLTLIKLGVLTEADLSEAEVWIRQAADQGLAVSVADGEFVLLSIEEWIARLAKAS